MNKYFTEYFPVEGEVNEGDMYFLEGSTLPIKKDSKLEKSFPLSCDNDPKIKVKLFLCSTNKNLGDTLRTPLGGEYIYTQEMADTCSTANDYKVVGEISPYALGYVREGQRFEDKDILPLYQYTSTSKPWNEEGWEPHGTSSGEEGQSYYYKYLEYFKIKGPCGHFH